MDDGRAKAALLRWSEQTTVFSGRSRARWLRACPPKSDESKRGVKTPTLNPVGSPFRGTQPDGLWIRLVRTKADPYVCDLVAVECCNSLQNLRDKRSRFSPSVASVNLHIREDWLRGSVKGRGRGGPAGERWKLMGLEADEVRDLIVPQRRLRVIYAVPRAHFDDWCSSLVFEAHEAVITQPKLSQFQAQGMQQFLKTLFRQTYPLSD